MRWILLFFLLFSAFVAANIELNNPEILIEGDYDDLENKLYSSLFTDDKISIQFSLRNRFKESDEIDFKSMTSSLFFNNESQNLSTFVDLGERKDYRIEMDIPDDIERGFYNSSFVFQVTYLNGTVENATIPFRLRIRTYENKIKIMSAQVFEDQTCRQHEVKFVVENIGKQNETDIRVELSEFDSIDAIYLNKLAVGDSYSASLYFSQNFADLELSAFDQFDNEFDSIELQVDIDCQEQPILETDQPINDLPRSNFEQELNKVQEQLEIEKYKQDIILQNSNAEQVDNSAQEQFVFVSIIAVFATIVLFLIFFRVRPNRPN